tara:strand:- start:10409 stop:11296 length:888 start_codon:yes stop_codon:yes gene_type:complete
MSNQIEYRHVRYFLEVARTLHFRQAAESLFISQPGLTRQIKAMENGLGIELFERHNRKVELTNTGGYLQKELTRNLNELHDIFEMAKLLDNGVKGRINFGYVGSAIKQLIPNLLLKFQEKHPDVTFDLKEMDNEQQIQKLLSNEIDIGFVRLERVPKDIEILQVLKESFCLVLPKKHPINEENFEGLHELKEESFILFDATYSPSYYEKVMQLFDDSGFVPKTSHSTIHASSIYTLVENGFGISIVPSSLKITNNSSVKFIELHNMKRKTVLSAVWNKKNKNISLYHLLEILKTI